MLEPVSQDKINHLLSFKEGLKWIWLARILRKSSLKVSFNPKINFIGF
jgi:hypothetical protein